jgi:hypothetical protein
MKQENQPKQTGSAETNQQSQQKRPNETGSISVEGFVRIFDPNTKEKFVEKRA